MLSQAAEARRAAVDDVGVAHLHRNCGFYTPLLPQAVRSERDHCYFTPVPSSSLSLYLSPPLSLICMCRLNDILSTKLKCAWHTERASPARVSFPTSRLCPPAGGTATAAAAASAACRLSQQIACSCFASQCASFMSLLSVYPVLNLNRWCDAT